MWFFLLVKQWLLLGATSLLVFVIIFVFVFDFDMRTHWWALWPLFGKVGGGKRGGPLQHLFLSGIFSPDYQPGGEPSISSTILHAFDDNEIQLCRLYFIVCPQGWPIKNCVHDLNWIYSKICRQLKHLNWYVTSFIVFKMEITVVHSSLDNLMISTLEAW